MSNNKRRLRLSPRAVLVREEKGEMKVLLQNFDDQGFWNLPGGGWEPQDESAEACLIREMKEETGIDITVDTLLFTQHLTEGNTLQMEPFYLVEAVDITQYKPCHEDPDKPGKRNELQWFTFEEMCEMRVLPEFFVENGKSLIAESRVIYTTGVVGN